DKLYPYRNGLAFIRKDNKVGLIDVSGNVVLPPTYEIIKDFYGNNARVRNNGLWGVIDKTGKIVVPVEYDDIGELESNKITWAKKGLDFGILNGTTFTVMEGVEKIWDFGGSELTYAKKGGMLGFINTQGNWVIEPKLLKVLAFKNWLDPVFINVKCGYVITSGEMTITASYHEAEVFS